MAQNVFDATLDVNNEIKVNTFDWSHANNLTTQIGRVTPIFCELVPSKSSVRINPRMGLQFMPMVFPVQTRMKARIAFFKYPLRALWSGYRDFVGNFRQDLEEPYINLNTSSKLKRMASTGSLGDYLGLPTTILALTVKALLLVLLPVFFSVPAIKQVVILIILCLNTCLFRTVISSTLL